MGDYILTGLLGDNSDLFRNIFSLYGKGATNVADVTFGKGVFWKQIDTRDINFLPSDITGGIDLRDLPYCDGEIDFIVVDPPYAHSSATPIKKSINDQYNINSVCGRDNILRLYFGGIIEAFRVLRKGGILVVKCQDEVMGGKQCFNHIVLLNFAEVYGFVCEDIFVLVQRGRPAMRHKYQIHARKNHSYFLVFRRSK
mgnify:CR=1 FL=1